MVIPLDLTLRYKPSKEAPWSFSMGVQDLFDSDALDVASPSKSLGQYEVPNEIPIYGRQFFMELGYRF
jgi:outer membrane receptor protein involved in Fe transport